MENTQGSETSAGKRTLPVPGTESGIAKAIPPWEIRISQTKQIPYFFNTETKESRWDAPQVQARHLLVKHQGSRRPSSWKENNITRTKEEAIAMLHEYKAQLDGSEDKQDTFAKLAEDYSDCSSHERGGSLGWFARGAMQKPFEDATFALQVGQVSEIISTDSGVHLILRTG